MSKHTIPLLLAVFDSVEAIICFVQRDFARGIYWLSAATITISTVMMKG